MSKNSLVLEMIKKADLDDDTKKAMESIFINELAHLNSPSKVKVNRCREIVEKVVK